MGIAHEIGHNLGLEHSGYDCDGCQDNLKSYMDGTGYMGLYSSSTADDDIRKCFNAQKSYKLGWYTNQAKSVDPLHKKFAGKPPRAYELIGPVSYTGEKNGRYVSLELAKANRNQFSSKWYVGYNHAKDFAESCDSSVLPCIGTEDRDKVSVFEHNSTDWSESGGATSWKRHVFSGPGDSYEIRNFGGKPDKTVTVKLISVSGDLESATIEVSFPPKDNNEDGDCVMSTPKNECNNQEGCLYYKKKRKNGCYAATAEKKCKKKNKCTKKCKNKCQKFGCVWKEDSNGEFECAGTWG